MTHWTDHNESVIWESLETGETHDAEPVPAEDMDWYLDVILGGQYVNVCHTNPYAAARDLCGCGGHPYL